ncbi:histone-lysine N-methyltransferase SETMAR-like protein [Plakobranchus ocellatus]|uniref:Histone-lysine N-methyltransferase SETMAR-like protein n=1 Tax=Plakobranchus ocellatus TaxID=259542 RepID=A0AAV3YQN5_9GAST|nr:histone-lysine N-methyltransferase SETMAR-like protein [Plakobranchus ocellatus]
MATSNDLFMKQRSIIKFLAAERCSAANIHARMKAVYGEMCISDCAVRKWVRIFKGEDPRETILRDRKRSGRPLSASVTAHRKKIDCMIRANRRVKQKEIANSVGISKKRVHHIVTTVLGVILTALPLLMLLVLNIRLILEIRRSSRYLQYHLGADSHVRSVVSSEQIKITMMLVAVIVAFFVCNAPYLIYSLYIAVNNYDTVLNTRLTNSSSLKIFKFVCHSLLAIKSSCNFILYCWFSEKFCTTFKRIFCLHSCQVRPSSSAAANNSCQANGYNNNSHYTNNSHKHVHRPSCYITKETTC